MSCLFLALPPAACFPWPWLRRVSLLFRVTSPPPLWPPPPSYRPLMVTLGSPSKSRGPPHLRILGRVPPARSPFTGKSHSSGLRVSMCLESFS